MGKKHDEKSVIVSLKRLGCKFGEEASLNNVIKTCRIPDNLGIHQLGKLDYLRKLGYSITKLGVKNESTSHKKTRRGNKSSKDLNSLINELSEFD